MSFERYCKVIRVTEDDHILTAFGIAMLEKAGRRWQYAEKTLPSPNTWERDKRHLSPQIWECLEKKKMGVQTSSECYIRECQPTADYFTEVADLNLLAQLDPETFPCLLKPLIHPGLRHHVPRVEGKGTGNGRRTKS